MEIVKENIFIMRKLFFLFTFLIPSTILSAETDDVISKLSNIDLPVIYIETTNGEMPTYDIADHPLGWGGRTIKNQTKVPGRIRITQKNQLLYDSGNYEEGNSGMTIRVRGNTSAWKHDKKPYKIKLKAKADLLGKGKSKRYVLLANWMDRTLLRNDVSFELARRTSLDWTPSGEFVELYFNGIHQGNYWLGEQIRVDENRVKADYLIEMDTYYDETYRFRTKFGFKPNTNDAGLPVGIKYPDDDDLTTEQFLEIKELVTDVENAIYKNGDYSSKIDLDSFLDWYLVHEVTYNLEPNHPKSCYFHFSKGVMKAGPVWDFDWYTFQPSTWGLGISKSIYFGQLFKDPDVISRLKEHWNAVKPEFETVDDYILEKADLLALSDAINSKKWPCTSYVNGDDTMSFDQAIARMREALKNRIIEVDKRIQAL